MSDIERVNEIERMIAEGRMSAAQVFTQMKQLLPSAKAPASGKVGPVGEIEHDYNLLKVRWYSHPKYGQFKTGDKVYVAHPPAKVPEAWRVEPQNDYGVKGLIIGSPRIDGVRDNTYISEDSDNPAERLLYLMLTTPTPATTPEAEWVKCSERLPTEADEDCRGQVWSAYRDPVTKAKSGPHLQSVSMVLLYANDSPEALYWMPTGLKRPNPPAEGAEL